MASVLLKLITVLVIISLVSISGLPVVKEDHESENSDEDENDYTSIATIVPEMTTTPSLIANPMPTVLNETGNTDGVFHNHAITVQNITFIPKDLYVIRTLIYEVGIIADPDPSTADNATQTQDEINLSLYQPPQTNASTDWWQALNSNTSQVMNVSAVAFQRIIPVDLWNPEANGAESQDGSYESNNNKAEGQDTDDYNEILPFVL